MRAFNLTGRHLTGADKRSLARQAQRKRTHHRRSLVGHYGAEKGIPLAREIARRNERELLSMDGDRPTGAGVWRGTDGRAFLDFALWSADPAKSPAGRFPVVRF